MSARGQARARSSLSVATGRRRCNPTLWATALGNQIVNVPFANAYDVAVTIWVVAGPYATTQQTAMFLWQVAQQVYADERLGVHLSPLEIVDATANAKAANYAAFTCGAGNANVTSIAADIGARPGRINVYLVGLVDGSTARGNACAIGGRFVAIAAGSSADLLSHELGHIFGLEHIDDLTTDFDIFNVMHSASSGRQYLTEGQIIPCPPADEFRHQPDLQPAPGLADARLRSRHAYAQLPDDQEAPVGGRRLSAN